MSTSKSPWVIEVNEENFETEVLERSRQVPVVVDFWAPWCGPCRMLGPVLERLVQERNGEVVLAKVNTDEAQQLAMAFQIEGIPAVKAIRDGRVVLEFVGLLPEPQLRDFLQRILPSEADQAAKQAHELETNNPAEAEKLYRQALAEDRNQSGAALGLARVLVGRGADDEALELLDNFGFSGEENEEAEKLRAVVHFRKATQGQDERTLQQRLTAEPDNAQLRFQLGCVLAAAGRYPEALEMLLSAAERDRKLAAEKVRETMVKVFHLVGVRSDLADTYRQKLVQLLY